MQKIISDFTEYEITTECTPSENQQHFFREGNSEKRKEASRKSVRIMLLTTMKVQAKKVIQYTKNGEYIAEYLSTGKAGLATGICREKISEVALFKYGRKTAGGFVWRYKKEEPCNPCIFNSFSQNIIK